MKKFEDIIERFTLSQETMVNALLDNDLIEIAIMFPKSQDTVNRWTYLYFECLTEEFYRDGQIDRDFGSHKRFTNNRYSYIEWLLEVQNEYYSKYLDLENLFPDDYDEDAGEEIDFDERMQDIFFSMELFLDDNIFELYGIHLYMYRPDFTTHEIVYAGKNLADVYHYLKGNKLLKETAHKYFGYDDLNEEEIDYLKQFSIN